MEIQVHSEASSVALRSLASQLKNRSVANKAVAVQLSSWIKRNFDAEGGLNVAWAQLSPNYAKWKARKFGAGKPILQASGLLRASYAKFEYDENTATVGSDLKYAQYHEQGLPERNLPARPMLPPPQIAVREAMDVYRYFIEKAIINSRLK